MKIIYKDKEIETERKKISEIFKDEINNSPIAIVGAKYNNEYKNIDYEVEEDGSIELIDISQKEGMNIYIRTLVFIMGKAFEEIYPNIKLTIDFHIGHSVICDVVDTENNETKEYELTDEMLNNIKIRMIEIVNQNLKIEKIKMTRSEAEEFYKKNNLNRGLLQLDIPEEKDIYIYKCENYYNYFYDEIANRTGVCKLFDLKNYGKGFALKYPSNENLNCISDEEEKHKLAWALAEYEMIHRLLKVNTIYRLNKAQDEGKIKNVIMLAEALHEKKIANIADDIFKNPNVKMILIAGPSSSGKTTFAQRLGLQLQLNRIKPVTISVDNYFVERENNPKTETGEYDFECIEAIDIDLFNDHLTKLLNGEEVEMPEFDFKVGTKRYKGKKLKLAPDEVLVIEGIHCLNDKLTSKIPADQKYKIYISDLTVLNMDYYNRISTTDTRLVRRIVRDHQFRGYSAKHTISTWPLVNKGERENIFPFQESANSVFNTSLIYELAALKPIAMPLLEEIKPEEEEYAEARRIINILKYFKPISADLIPSNSLLKEFLGGGDFKY